MSFAEAKASMARAYASGKRPKLLSVLPNGKDELWALGEVAFVLPVVPAGAPPLLEYALRLRREATLTGACDQCGASFGVVSIEEADAPNMSASGFAHRNNCPATDENILPLLEKYYKTHDAANFSDELDSVRRSTKERVLTAIPNRVDINVTDEVKAKTNRLLDERLAATIIKTCGHLRSEPVQTWNLFLWDDTWRCGECLLRFSESVQRGAFRLNPIEDRSCDYCHRYAPNTLTPVVMRVDIFVMHGAMCRRCAREWGHQEEVGVKR